MNTKFNQITNEIIDINNENINNIIKDKVYNNIIYYINLILVSILLIGWIYLLIQY